MPGLEEAIDTFWTSTPLTYEYYTATRDGSAFGITKDWQSPMTTVLSPRTPIENLLLTGQNLNLHGILGTSMTSLFTTAKMLGKDKIKQEINL
jgi:all-trans-retinol 13,14-reductase